MVSLDVGSRQPPTQSEGFDVVHGAEKESALQHHSTVLGTLLP